MNDLRTLTQFNNCLEFSLKALSYEHAKRVRVYFGRCSSCLTIMQQNDYFICYFKNKVYALYPLIYPYLLFNEVHTLAFKYGGWETIQIEYFKSTRKELRKYE